MMLKSHRLLLVLLFSPLFSNAASFAKYAPKLLRFEGAGYGIHKPVWGDREFTKEEALDIYKREFWNKYYGNHFKSQALAEVVIDHIINAGAGKGFQNIKAFQAILSVEQTGKLTLADIRVANAHDNPTELVNSYVKYRVLYYKSRKLASKYPGWEKRARSFFVNPTQEEISLVDYNLPEYIEEQYAHIEISE